MLDDPLTFVESFFNAYPLATKQLLASENSPFFLAISQRAGQKPVPFIPVFDALFEVWFKKVSLIFQVFFINSPDPVACLGLTLGC